MLNNLNGRIPLTVDIFLFNSAACYKKKLKIKARLNFYLGFFITTDLI